MPIFKDIWKGATRPDKPNEFLTQFAQQLMMGGGSQGPIARMGNKLIGGLLHGGQRGGAMRQEAAQGEARKKFMGLLQPSVKQTLGAEPGYGVLSAMDVRPDQSLLGAVGPATGIPRPEIMPTQEVIDADPWAAIEMGMASDDPLLQKMALDQYAREIDKGWEPITLPTGELMMWDGKDPDSMRTMVGRKPPKVETKTVGKQLLEKDPVTGTWEVVHDATGTEGVIKSRTDTDTDNDGFKWQQKVDYELLPNGDIGWEREHGWGPASQQVIAGPIEGADAVYNRFLKQKIIANEDATSRTVNIKNDLEGEFGEDYIDFFTIPGRVSYEWSALKDKLVGLDENSPEYRKLARQAGFVRSVMENANLYIKDITGAQMSEAEASRLMKAVINPGDSPAQVAGKLESEMERLRSVQDAYERRLKATGSVEAAERAAKTEKARLVKEHWSPEMTTPSELMPGPA